MYHCKLYDVKYDLAVVVWFYACIISPNSRNMVAFVKVNIFIVSTGGIRWIIWFSVSYAAATACREIFGVNAVRGKLHQLDSPNLQDIFIGG